MVTRDVDPTAPLGAKRGIQTQIEVREHASGSHSVLLVNTLDRPGLLTGEWWAELGGMQAAGLNGLLAAAVAHRNVVSGWLPARAAAGGRHNPANHLL